jgi:two-component system CheB/CheR fusion protein
VITFVDITRIREAESHVEELEYFKAIVQTVREPLIVLDDKNRVLQANDAFYKIFQTSQEAIKGKPIFDLGNGQWNIPQLHNLIEGILPKNAVFTDFAVEHDFPIIGYKKFLLNARRLQRSAGLPGLILLAMEENK